MQKAVKNVDEYIAGFPAQHQQLLKQLREIVLKTAPDALEVISYNMPAYKYNGMLVYFAAHTSHIGLYPTASGIKHFEKELAAYTTSKGAVQFPISNTLQVALIKKIIQFRIKENKEKSELKKLKKK